MTAVKQIVKRCIQSTFTKIGYGIIRYPENASLEATLTRFRTMKMGITSVIDVGSSDGRWSENARIAFPDARYLLIEANSVHEKDLKRYKAKRPNVEFVLAAAGDTVGEIYFDASDPHGGLASHAPTSQDNIRVPVTTIDIQVRERKLKPPYLIKLDTHGFEVPILEGAVETLKKTALVVIEVYNFTLVPGSLRFHEMCAFMEQKGFRPIGLCDPLYREKDNAFWQMDIFFAPNENPIFLDNKYA